MIPNLISSTLQEGYLRIDVVHGQWSYPGYAKIWIEIFGTIATSSADRALAVFSGELKGEVEPLELLLIETRLPVLRTRVALVNLHVASISAFEYASEVRNFHGADTKAFSCEAVALAWLFEGTGSATPSNPLLNAPLRR